MIIHVVEKYHIQIEQIYPKCSKTHIQNKHDFHSTSFIQDINPVAWTQKEKNLTDIFLRIVAIERIIRSVYFLSSKHKHETSENFFSGTFAVSRQHPNWAVSAESCFAVLARLLLRVAKKVAGSRQRWRQAREKFLMVSGFCRGKNGICEKLIEISKLSFYCNVFFLIVIWTSEC